MPFRTRLKAHFEFSSNARWTHWVRVLLMIGLTFTGFYIAYGFIAPGISAEPTLFLNAKMRMWHEILGFYLIAITIFKSYLFLFDIQSKRELVSFKDVIDLRIWFLQIKHYMFLGKAPKLRGIYNPLQFAAYFTVYVSVFALSLTGLILYVNNYHEGLGGLLYAPMRFFEAMFGGLANVRMIHHIFMWILLVFTPMHIYMAVLHSIKNRDGSIDAMIGGYKFSDKH